MKNVLTHGIFGILFMCIASTHAQVGIGTSNPQADLHIEAKSVLDPGEYNGVIIPRVSVLPSAPAPEGLLIYLTTTSGVNPPGLYFSDGVQYLNVTDAATATSAFLNYGTSTTATTPTANVSRTGTVNIGSEGFRTGMLNVENNLTSAATVHSTLRLINNNTGTAVGNNTHGIYTENRSDTGGIKYGIRNEVTASGLGTHIGIRNVVADNASASNGGSVIGIDNSIGQVTGTAAGIANFGLRSSIGNASSTGPIYGIYSEAVGTAANSDVYGALINGRLAIGDLARTTGYDFPTDRGLTGQLLTTDGNGTAYWSGPVAARVLLTNNQAITTANTWEKLNFNNPVVNAGNAFNTASNQFVAPVAGVYRVFAQFHSTDNDPNRIYVGISIHVNGTIYSEHSVNHYANNQIFRSTNALVNLNTNDVIEVYFRSDATTTTADSFSSKSFFEVSLVR